MFRLLIVDDEEIIVNGLYEIFKSKKELELDVYKAYSSDEAIEWLNRTRIDIVISDIRMPGMDGLQLLEVIQKSWPQSRVIFLSGHKEFEYVYKALQHGCCVSYILKTEDHEKVVNSVESAINEIKKGNRIEDLIQKAKEQIDLAKDLFQRDYLVHLLHEDTSLEVSKQQFEQLSIPLYPEHPVVLLVGHIDIIPTDLSYWDKIQFLHSVKVIMNMKLSTHIRCINVIDESYRIIMFIQPVQINMVDYDATYSKLISFIKGTLEVVQSACRESLDATISFAMSGEPTTWKTVSQEYYSLNQLLNQRIGSGIETILTDNDFHAAITEGNEEIDTGLEDAAEQLDVLLRQRNLETLESYLENGQRDKFFDTLTRFLDPLKQVRSKNNNKAIEAYYKIALCLLAYINRTKLSGKIAFHIGQNSLMRMDRFESWDEAVQYIHQMANIIFNLQTEEQNYRADNTVKYLQQYVEEHLSEDLSLVRLAEQVYLNPSYLSRLYKQVTGKNLSELIDQARIREAKQLLSRENIKVSEVSRLVGYETTASFSRFYKKSTGLTPQEYHDACMTEKQNIGKVQ